MRRRNDRIDKAIQDFIRIEVDRALHPGMVEGHTSRRIRISDPDGTEWRGFVWPVSRDEPLTNEKEEQP